MKLSWCKSGPLVTKMKRKFRALLTIIATTSTLFSHAGITEDLDTYVATCKERLGISTLPSFTCSDGIRVPVDNNGYLGKAESTNESIDAVFLCRSAETSDSLIGLIVHNRVGGDTCFFDAHVGSRGVIRSPFGADPSTQWQQPEHLSDNPLGRCYKCHANDPFLVTNNVLNGMARLDLLNNGHATSPYHIPGDEFQSWDSFIKQNMQPLSGGGCTQCHRMSDSRAMPSTPTSMPPMPGSPWEVKALPIKQNFENGLGWQSPRSFKWRTNRGNTSSAQTGPETGADGSSSYAYFETSRGDANTDGDDAILLTESFLARDYLNREAILSFSWHMFGADTGLLAVDVHSNGRWVNHWYRRGQQHESSSDPWHRTTLRLTGYTGKIKVAFRTVAAGGYRGDIAIDEISIARTSDAQNQILTWPTRRNQFGIQSKVWYSESNGHQLCRQEGFTRMKSYSTGCGENETPFMTFSDFGQFGWWRPRLSGSKNQCYNLFSKVVCE